MPDLTTAAAGTCEVEPMQSHQQHNQQLEQQQPLADSPTHTGDVFGTGLLEYNSAAPGTYSPDGLEGLGDPPVPSYMDLLQYRPCCSPPLSSKQSSSQAPSTSFQ
jgi:hypothetical protein